MTAPPTPPSSEQKEADFQRRLGQLRAEREKDLAAGRERGEELFGEGRLGRVEAGVPAGTQRLVEERRAGLGGLTSQQQTQARERARQGITEQSQTELARLRGILGRQGRQLDDPSAVAQQRRILERAQRVGGGVERDLALADISLQEQRRQQLESITGRAETGDLNRALINLQQQQRETAGQLQTEFGLAGLGSTERFGLRQLQAAEEQQATQALQQQEAFRLQEKTIDKPAPSAPSGKLICGELNRQGLLADDIYAGDLVYAQNVPTDTRDGYIAWSKYYVKLMKKSKIATYFILPFGKGWAKEMAFRTGHSRTGSLIGKILTYTGEPICSLIGKVRRLLNYKTDVYGEAK